MTNPIVGIGELLWDIYPDGGKVAGGAPFNFAFHCHRLGHPAVIVSRVGDDDLGRELRAEVRRLGLTDAFIQTDPDHPTGTVNVTLDAAGVPTYTIAEDVAWDFIEPSTILDGLSERAAAACFGTLAQRGSRSRDTIARFTGWRFDGPHPVKAIYLGNEVLNPTLRVFDVNLRAGYHSPAVIQRSLFLADWVKLNTGEAAGLYRVFGRAVGDYESFLTKLRPLDGRNCVILSDGAAGCRVLAAGEDFAEPAAPARVVDTVGAGDSFTAAMVCLHLEGRPLRDCARFASHYAARVCEHPGATPLIDRAEVERAAFGAAPP